MSGDMTFNAFRSTVRVFILGFWSRICLPSSDVFMTCRTFCKASSPVVSPKHAIISCLRGFNRAATDEPAVNRILWKSVIFIWLPRNSFVKLSRVSSSTVSSSLTSSSVILCCFKLCVVMLRKKREELTCLKDTAKRVEQNIAGIILRKKEEKKTNYKARV